jgi:hypothetical protein
MRRAAGLPVVSALFLVAVAASARAQDSNSFFNLSTPGARANGMGASFVAVADDATASVTNPSGLVFLTRPQVYVEFKGSAFTQQAGLGGTTFKNDAARVGFLAASMPIGTRFAVSVTRHEFLASTEDFVGGERFRNLGTTYGGSVAANVGHGLMVGATVARGTLSTDATGTGLIFSATIHSTGVTVGGLWRASEKIAVGVSGAHWARSDDVGFGFVQPNQFRAGVSVQPVHTARVSAEFVRLNFLFEDSRTEVHLGGEYQLPQTNQPRVYVRGGVNVADEEVFDPGVGRHLAKTVIGTGGLGLVFGRHLQIDTAVLTRKEVIVSAGVRF